MRNDELYLQHIDDAISYIEQHLAGVERVEFLHDKLRQDAVVFELLAIGEAARNLSDKLRQQYDEVDWAGMIGMRNIIRVVPK